MIHLLVWKLKAARIMNNQAEMSLPVKNLINSCLNDFSSFVIAILKAGKEPEISDWEVIADSGTFSRFFRRWYQTTWGKERYCDFFNGTTPRQRLEKEITAARLLNGKHIFINPRINEDILSQDKGIAYYYYSLAYSTRKQDDDYIPLPIFTEFTLLARLLENGLSSNNKGILRASYRDYWPAFHLGDKDLLVWVVEILLNMGLLEFRPSERKPVLGKLFLNSKGKAYFSLDPQDQITAFFDAFMELAVNNITSAAINGAIFNKRQIVEDAVRIAIKKDLKTIFISSLRSSDWIYVDVLFDNLWAILHKHFPNKLLSPKDFAGYIEKPKYWESKEPIKSIFTKSVYYEVGLGFDRHLLFPMDRYFGLAECVWTDDQNILQDIQTYLGLARELAGRYGYYSTVQDKEDYAQFCEAFFSPCTCFRIAQDVCLPVSLGK